VIQTPIQYVTDFRLWTGASSLASPTTVSTVFPTNGGKGTYIVDIPGSFVTSTETIPWAGTGTRTLATILPTGTEPGTGEHP